jgi:hypothetical protein
MHKRVSALILALAFFAVAGMSLAQNADKNTAGPTKNDLRLRVTEPAEGSTVVGTSVRVTVDYNRAPFGSGQGTKFGEANFPPAKFDVFLDNKLVQTLTTGESNIATIESVPAGSHKIVVLAKNLSGEVIDRKEINFVSTPEVAATNPPPAAAPAPATTIETQAPPPPPASSYSSRTTQPAPSAPEPPATMPQTASSAPRLALAGLALAFVGLVLSRKAR